MLGYVPLLITLVAYYLSMGGCEDTPLWSLLLLGILHCYRESNSLIDRCRHSKLNLLPYYARVTRFLE